MKKILFVAALIALGWYFLHGRGADEAKRLSFEGNWSVTRTRENFNETCNVSTNGEKYLVTWSYMVGGKPKQEIYDGKGYYESNVKRTEGGKYVGDEKSWTEALASQKWHVSSYELQGPSQQGALILGRSTNLYQAEGQSNWLKGGSFKEKIFVDPQTDLVLKQERSEYAPDGSVFDVYTFECKKLEFKSVPDTQFPLPETIYSGS